MALHSVGFRYPEAAAALGYYEEKKHLKIAQLVYDNEQGHHMILMEGTLSTSRVREIRYNLK